MADRVIRIVIDPRGAKRGARAVRKSLGGITQDSTKTSSALGFLKRAIGGLGLALAVRQLARYADSFTVIQNRLKVAGIETVNLASATERLAKISRETRTSLDANVALFQRLSIASGELGATQEDLFTFTEGVGRALAIQGGAASEASGAIRQLSQAVGSGIVRAEEFNSILEGAFPIALAVAKGLDKAGGSVAKLRNLIITGNVTSTEFFRAFLSQSDALGTQFGQTTATISQAFQVLNDSFTLFLGSADQGVGISRLLANAILFVANNLDVATKALVSLGAGLAAVFGIRVLTSIRATTGAIHALTVALLLNPFTVLAVAATAAATALFLFRNQIFPIPGSIASLGDIATVVFGRITTAVSELTGLFDTDLSQSVGFFGRAFTITGEIVRENFNLILQQIKLAINSIIALGRTTVAVGVFVKDFLSGADTGGLSDQIKDIFSEDVVGDFVSTGLQGIREIGAGIRAEAEQLARQRAGIQGPAAPPMMEADATAAEAVELTKKQTTALRSLRDQLDPVGAAQRELVAGLQLLNVAQAAGAITTQEFAELNERLVKSLAAQLDPLTALRTEIELERDLIGLSNEERQAELALRDAQLNLTGKQREALRGELVELEKLREQFEVQREVLEEIEGPQEDYLQRLAAINDLFTSGAINAEQFNEKINENRITFLDSQKDLESGFERGLLRAQAQVEDFASLSEELVTGAFKSMEDGLVEFVNTGKLDFADLADSIIRDLQRIAIRKAIAGIFGAIGGGVGGGNQFTGDNLVGTFRHGGVTDRPAIFGEGQTREAAVPLPNGRSIPAVITDPTPRETVVELTIVNQLSGQASGAANRPDVLNEINEDLGAGGVTRRRIRKALGGR